ncbi:MAG: RluA family pseudouridine synthase [Burkholderiales bacterium]|nr:RluA family pseudouridine synthase [Burkholderiales bacterium]
MEQEEKSFVVSSDYIEEHPSAVEPSQKDAKKFIYEVGINDDGDRLDKVLSAKLPDISRSRIKNLIESGCVLINGEPSIKPKQKLQIGQLIEMDIKPRPEDESFIPVDIPLDIVYEDDSLLVINKPPGLVVHPAAGHWQDTLLNGLLFHRPQLKNLPRAGIVHRLDRDTSGLMVVAKTEVAQNSLVNQLQERTVKREYWAIVKGGAPKEKTITASIERDPHHPLRFSIGNSPRAKPATTSIRLVQTNQVGAKTYSWIAARLKTGRTHQIRVHMESLGLPLVGDPLYRSRLPVPKDDGSMASTFNRQALHASRLGLIHPETNETIEWFVEPPEDFKKLMEELSFAPWDKPVKVFEDPLVNLHETEELSESNNGIGTITSWKDFDFGDEEE